MTDLATLRLYDSGEPPAYRQFTPKAFMPIAVFDAMTDEELHKLLPNARRVLADAIRRGALAQIAADAERESA